MPLSPTSAPTDLHELLTNIGVLIAAVAASAAGIWQAIRKARKAFEEDKPDDRKKVLSAAIIETVSIQQWSETNRLVAEHTRILCNRIEDLIEELRDHRSSTRDFNEEARRLRLAVTDLYEVAKALRK